MGMEFRSNSESPEVSRKHREQIGGSSYQRQKAQDHKQGFRAHCDCFGETIGWKWTPFMTTIEAWKDPAVGPEILPSPQYKNAESRVF
eukprot:scaffold5650_cov121-Cylindrotheca_fusiformis.AAC.2